MRVYIAGPMQGYRNFNYDAFDKAASVIEQMGHEVINPADNFDRRQDLPYQTYIDKAMEQVTTVDTVVKLPGWEASNGVKREMAAADANGVNHVTYQDFVGQPGPQNAPDFSAFLPMKFAPAQTITEQAWELVVEGDRQSTYGHPSQDFKTTGRQWGALIENWLVATGQAESFPDIPPKIVALMMAALKASRESQKPKRDNRLDGIGYWLCADRIEEDY